MKLCAMYLMDSIVKNVGEPYLSRFARHLVSVFGGFYGLPLINTSVWIYR